MSNRCPALVFVLLMALTPMLPMAVAHPSIGLSLDASHVILSPGEATNVTLTIHNNGSSIEDYQIAVSGNGSEWEVVPSATEVTNVIPTYSDTATIAIRLSTAAVPSDSSSVVITVTEPDANISSTITVLLSVQARYLPAIDANDAGDNGLVEMAPGDQIDLPIQIRNDGNVEDTILLSVDQSPDIAAFWANWTSGGNSSSNNSGGNNSGDNGTGGTGNQTGNGTGGTGNQTGNSTNVSISLSSVLMFGNSYTQQNSLHSLLQNMVNSAGGNVSASALTGGGMRLPQHFTNVNTSGNQWNTTLSNSAWDYVVLQDQSQVPSFPRTDTYWIDSKNAAISLADRIDSEGSDVVLLMTWGRRAGDAQNPIRNSNFTVMQENLESGYLDFQSNMTSSTSANVWVAPVGLAWKAVHDDVVASNLTPTAPGNMFFDLYSSDGSHPSLSGSYLAACVLYSTLTGMSPVGVNDSTNLNSTLKLQLQQYAADTVLNNTPSLSYPWQSNGTGSGGGTTSISAMMSGPQGWEVRFLDDSMDNMTAAETRTATLRISIPSNEVPGYYGFDLFAASALGNFSVSTTLVVNVTAVHDLVFTHDAPDVLLPGENTTVVLDIESLSTAAGDWTITSQVSNGDCSVELESSQLNISDGATESLNMTVTADANTVVGDECTMLVTAVLDSDSQIIEHYSVTVTVGEQWGLSMVLPTSIKLDVGELESFNVVVNNDGTETDTISLIGIDQEGVTFTNPQPVTLTRGESQYVVMQVLIDEGHVGNITLHFQMSSTNSGEGIVNDSETFEVKEYASLSITGPSDGRMTITPGESTEVILELSNDGTKDLDLAASISGLPSGITVLSGLDNIMLSGGNATNVSLILEAANSMSPSDTEFTISFDGGWANVDLTLDLQIIDLLRVSLDSSTTRIVASPMTDEVLELSITNLGTASDTYVITLNDTETSEFFTTSLSTLSLTLDSGASQMVNLSAREVLAGAPISGTDLVVTVTSTLDSSISDELTISVVPQVAGGLITVMSDDDKAAPGDIIYGSVVITNLGTGTDSMLITTLEMDCGLGQVVELGPSMSSTPITWVCTLPEDATAGIDSVTFRLTSSARPAMVEETIEAYTVIPVWDNDVISFEFDSTELVFDESNEQQTIALTVCNMANTYLDGTLELLGKNEAVMSGQFFHAGETGVNNTYELAAGGCQDFRILLTPTQMDGFEADLVVRSVSQIQGATIIDESPRIHADVAGPHLPPDGLNFGFMELSNQDSITLLAAGYVLSLVLIMYIRLFRKPAVEEEEEEEELEPLAANEVRIDEYDKVTCPECEARLGVPAGSEPPFRFTCPTCQARIRVVE